MVHVVNEIQCVVCGTSVARAAIEVVSEGPACVGCASARPVDRSASLRGVVGMKRRYLGPLAVAAGTALVALAPGVAHAQSTTALDPVTVATSAPASHDVAPRVAPAAAVIPHVTPALPQLEITAGIDPTTVYLEAFGRSTGAPLEIAGRCAPTCTFAVPTGPVLVHVGGRGQGAPVYRIRVPEGGLRYRLPAPSADDASDGTRRNPDAVGAPVTVLAGVTSFAGLVLLAVGAFTPPTCESGSTAPSATGYGGVPTDGWSEALAGAFRSRCHPSDVSAISLPLGGVVLGAGLISLPIGLVLLHNERAAARARNQITVGFTPDLRQPGASLAVRF